MSTGAVTEILQQGIGRAVPYYRSSPVVLNVNAACHFFALYEIKTPPDAFHAECMSTTLH